MSSIQWLATHRITFVRSDGNTTVWLVMLRGPEGGSAAYWPAATEAEWLGGLAPAWSCDAHGHWNHRGFSRPDNVPGKVVVEILA